MTREQAIRELKIQFIGEYDRQREAFDMAIKALEQEPILDKIRAEILKKCFDVPYENQAFDYGLKIVKWSDVSKILDKYKAESEDKE